MSALVDSSVWIQYLRVGEDRLDWLIDEGLIYTNELILAELLPPLMIRRKSKLIRLLRDIPLLSLKIDWSEIEQWQCLCLQKGINKVGIPDLIIAQNAKQQDISIFSYDRHFAWMAKHLGFGLF